MRNKRFPNYPDDTDYTTNAPSYYDDLARKQKLIELLSKRIWEYDEELAKRFEEWDQNLEDLPEDVKNLLQQWLDNGTLDHIINDTIFNWKLDTIIFEQFRDAMNTQMEHIVSINKYPRESGETTDTPRLNRAIDAIKNIGGVIDFPAGEFVFTETITLPSVVGIRGVGKGRNLNRFGTVFLFRDMPLNQVAIKIGTGTTDHYGMSLENIMIIGEGSDYAGIGIELTDGSYNYQLNNIDIQHFHTAVRVNRSWDMTINLITIRYCIVGFEFVDVTTSMTMNSCVVYGAQYAYDFKSTSELYYSTINSGGSDGSINVVRMRGKVAGLAFYNFDFESGTSGNKVMYGWDIDGKSIALSIHGGKSQNVQMDTTGAVFKIGDCQSVDIYGARHDSSTSYAKVFDISDQSRGRVRLFGGYYTGVLGDINKVNNVSSNGVSFKGLTRESLTENYYTSKGKTVVTSTGTSVQNISIILPTGRWFSGLVKIHGKDNGTNSTISGGLINITANNVAGELRPTGEVLSGDCTVTHTTDAVNNLITFELTSPSHLTVFEFDLTLFGSDTASWLP